MNHCSYVYITTSRKKVNTILKSFVNGECFDSRSPWQSIRNAARWPSCLFLYPAWATVFLKKTLKMMKLVENVTFQ